MPNWSNVLTEIRDYQDVAGKSLDTVRRKYLANLHEKTGRNVITYYSAWLQRPGIRGTDLTDLDKNGFMNAIHGLDRSKGLDLVLHTPGGAVAAAESIVDYLHSMFGANIRAIVPQVAMSAGTMMACACKTIVMGKQSSLGPFDPHFGGVPAQGVIDEFKRAMAEVKSDQARIPIWQAIISKYHPTFIAQCENAVVWSKHLVTKWLADIMFSECANPQKQAEETANKLLSFGHHISHNKHISIGEAKASGLIIEDLEVDNEFQDLVLTVHHAYMHTFSHSTAINIIENQNGNAIINLAGKEA